MKFAAFNVANHEIEIFKEFEKKYNINIELYSEELNNSDNIDLSQYDAISTISLGNIPNSIIDRLTKCKLITLRSIGFQYIDLDYCKAKGIAVSNSFYDPYNVADFTVMMMLMALRKAKVSVCRALVNDFSLHNMMGREMRSLKIGILGTGKIGSRVIEELSGFNSEIYCYDIYQNDFVKKYAKYESIDYILNNCDIISLHMPLTKDNVHLINEEAINKMKDGAIIVNTSRGGLIDTKALIKALETNKLSAVALDTIENEDGLFHYDSENSVTGLYEKRDIMYLKQFPNALITQHFAFFTKEAVNSMIDCTFKGIKALINNTEIPFRVNK